MEAPRAAEDYGDYRFFRFVTVASSRLVIAILFLVGWNLVFFRQRETLIFLGSTGVLALGLSLVAAMVAYMLFKRRGGKVEKSKPPMAT